MPSASKMRSEPEAWSARVITARPPAFSTAAAIASESVATTTSPRLAASARAQHMHDHRLAGDIGERLAGQAGGGHAGPGSGSECRVGPSNFGRLLRARPAPNQCRRERPLIRVARARANRLSRAPPRARFPRASPPLPPAAEPHLDGFLRTQQNPGRPSGDLPGVLSLNIAAGAIFTPSKLDKPGYAIAVPETRLPATAGQARAGGADRGTAGELRPDEGRDRRQAMRGLPHLREGRAEPGRPQSLGHRRPRRRHRVAGLQLFGRHEGQGRQLDLSTISTISSTNPKALCPAPI